MVEKPFQPALPSEPPPDDGELHLPVTWPADGPKPVKHMPSISPSISVPLVKLPFGPGSGKPFGRR